MVHEIKSDNLLPSSSKPGSEADQENVKQNKSPRSFAGITSSTNNDSRLSSVPAQPEFGKKSPLRNKLMSVFNIPKKGAARPEHHRTQLSNPPSRSASGDNHNVKKEFIIPPVIPRFDNRDQPYMQVAPPPPLFSTTGSTSMRPITIPSGPSRNVIDLTKNADSDDEFDPNAALRTKEFGAPDPFEYVDPTRANENLKQLLEGAFDDDEEEGKRRKLPRRVKTATDPVTKVVEGAKSLADKLKLLDVKDEKPIKKKAETPEEEEEEEGVVDGLNVNLLPHQIDGVAWMIERESGTKKRGVLPKGGILADDMGLGKTIQAISLILMNPRPSIEVLEKDKKKKIPTNTTTSTLVIAPLALIRQWESEIKTKAPELKVHVHHGTARTTSASKLSSYDVVITTYQTIMSENRDDVPDGGCFLVNWYRIILDEAHSIKNPRAKTTQACYRLKSVYRWCLTGTPLQNNLDELQSLIRFLKIKPYSDHSVWKRDITDPIKNGRGGVGLRRLHYFLKAFMKRRTKDVLKQEGALGKASKDGEGFKIVGREINAIEAEFDYNERKFYERLESRAQDSLKDMMSERPNDYIGALVLLLRLRQACNHPYLMRAKMEKDRDALSTGNTNGNRGQQIVKTEDEGLDGLTNLLGGLSVQSKECDVCKSKLSKEEVARGSDNCDECEADLQEQISQEKKQQRRRKSKKSRKSEERQKLRNARRRIVVDSDDEDEAEWIVKKLEQSNNKEELHTDDENEEAGGDWIGSEDSETDSEDEEESHEDLSEEEEQHRKDQINFHKPMQFSTECVMDDLPPSTKIKQLMSILKTETKEHKVIVFSQFTSMLDIIEPFLIDKNYSYVRYDGSMRPDQREASLNMLRNNERTRVLICSLKCGSLGLNLTAASRVVIMEPFWNPFVEEQAIDRVHRLNQTKDVVVYKLTIAGTVEERIVELQETKRALAAAALDGGKGAAKLSMADILNLFKFDHHSHDIIDSTPDLDGMGRLLGIETAEDRRARRREEYRQHARGF